MTAQGARVWAMRPPTRTGVNLTCRVMPRHFDCLSVGEEFGADCPSLARENFSLAYSSERSARE
jgi:hypothetical protein